LFCGDIMVSVNTDVLDTVIDLLISAFTTLFESFFGAILNFIGSFVGGDLTANSPALLALVLLMLATGGVMAWKIGGVAS